MTNIASFPRAANRAADDPDAKRKEIIIALGGNLANGMCFCPAHDNHKTPSLHVSVGNGKVLVKCHAGCSQSAVLTALKARGLALSNRHNADLPAVVPFPSDIRRGERTASALKVKGKGDPKEEEAARLRDEASRLRNAAVILRAAAEYAKENPGAEQQLSPYLRGRGIDRLPRGARYLPAAEISGLDMGLPPFPAMVQSIADQQGLKGALVTFLNRDGTKNMKDKNGKSVRRTFGPIKGGFVQLGKWPERDKPLIVAEGVEKAMRLSQFLGHAAIAGLSASNIKDLKPPPCSKLIIGNDNDRDGAGLKAAEHLAARYRGHAYIVSPPTGFKDWEDALDDANERDLEAYRQQFADAEAYAGEPEVAGFLTMSEVLALDIPPLESFMGAWLTTSSIGELHARRGEGKTRFIMAVVYAVACGQSFLRWEVKRPAKVLYIDGELPAALLQKRLKLLGPATANLAIVSRDLLRQQGTVLPDLATEKGRAFLDRIIEQHNSEVIILDSLSTLIHSGAENEAESWAPVQAWLLEHRFRGRAIIFIAHEGHQAGRARGTSKREDTIDFTLGLKKIKEDDSEEVTTYELNFGKQRELPPADAAPLLLHLTIKSDTATWRWEYKRAVTRDRVVELDKQGMKQKDIAKEMGLSQSQVSRLLAAKVSDAAEAEADEEEDT